MPVPRRRHRALPTLALALGAFSTACGAASDGRFDAQPATPSPTCLQHQQPGTRYTGGQQADPT
ncbi:hypothetical protein [Kitasatospora azatica]|uniref:hypothetical protein n=1 Tax=Kitasatospora azatica TaxID=58347 RepID=UPI00068DD247|nr:hypothetical protein [Kitasatospora azatica]